jgi:membrane protease YdiL (CAAX protease family)
MIGSRHYERILTLPTYAICRKTLALLALLLGVLPVVLYIIGMFFAAAPELKGPRINETAAVVLTVFLAVIALIGPFTAAVLNKVLVEKKIGRPPFRFLYGGGEIEEAEGEEEEERRAKLFEPQFSSMAGILFAISDVTALFGLVLGILGRGWGYAIPFFIFSLAFSSVLYIMLKNQLFALLSQHFDLIEGGGKAKIVE